MTRTPPTLLPNSLSERRRPRTSLSAVGETETEQTVLRTTYSDSAAAGGASGPRQRRDRPAAYIRRVRTAPSVASPNTSACGDSPSAQCSIVSQALSDQTNSYSVYRMFPDRRGTASATAAVSSPSRHYREHVKPRGRQSARDLVPVRFALSPQASRVQSATASPTFVPEPAQHPSARSGSVERPAGECFAPCPVLLLGLTSPMLFQSARDGSGGCAANSPLTPALPPPPPPPPARSPHAGSFAPPPRTL